MLTTDQVLAKLAAEGITENIQMVRRWIRQGDLPAKAPAKRKDGYLVAEADLATFINRKRKKPKKTAEEYEAEIQELREELSRVLEVNACLHDRIEELEGVEQGLRDDLRKDTIQAKQKVDVVQPFRVQKDSREFTERFQFQKKKYEVKVRVIGEKYEIYIYEDRGRFPKEVPIDKSSPLFKRFLEIVREKYGVGVEMALQSWKQLVPVE